MASGPVTSWQIEGVKEEAVTDFLFLDSKITELVTAAMKSDDCFLAESNDKPRQCVEQQRHHSADKVPYSQDYGLPNSHICF